MQKNDKFYTFLFRHLFNKKDQESISRNLIHSGIVLAFLVVGFSAIGIGIHGVFRNTALEAINTDSRLVTQVSAQIAPDTDIEEFQRSDPADIVPNSGGPAASEADPESAEIENRLKAIQETSDPAYIPTMWAHAGKINNEFGFRRNPFGGRVYEFHPGMDIDGERGEEIIAPANGIVTKAGWTGGYGNMVEIDHGNGLATRYGHMSKIEVSVGDTISRGQLIGLIGSTGRSTGPHLHYELRLDDRPVNPRHYLPPEPINIVDPNKQ